LSVVEFGKNVANLSNQFAAGANCRFQFKERSQLFIRVHNDTFSVAVRIRTKIVRPRA
jgi:hypothetical protein